MSHNRSLLLLAICFVPLSLGCSDPVPNASQGALQVTMTGGSSVDCAMSIPMFTETVGEVDGNAHGAMATDGVSGARVECGVRPAGGGFDIDGYIAIESRGLSLDITKIYGMTAAASSSSPAKGTVAFRSVNTVKVLTSQDCNFWFEGGQGAQLAEGRVWMKFACPTIANCQLGGATGSYVALQNCEIGEE